MWQDSRYYEQLGEYEIRLSFFKEFIREMRVIEPGFGIGCYVDSTPLPNTISDLPTNRMCVHGLDSVEIQSRIVLILDYRTGLPVWFDIIPGNVLDLNTVMKETEFVRKMLDISIGELVLDADYVFKEVIEAYNLSNSNDKTLIARMPNKKGFDMDVLFNETKGLFADACYAFVRQDHTYFRIRKEIELFSYREYAYIYVDHENVSSYFREYMFKKGDEFECLSIEDKEKTRYKGGFFVLLSNIEDSPDRILDRYCGRTEIETVFLTGKNYLSMLPLGKHDENTIKGRIMQDIIDIIVYLMIRKCVNTTGGSVSDFIYDLQSVGCIRQKGVVSMDIANKQAREAYALLSQIPPTHVDVKEYRFRTHLSNF